MRRYVRPVYAMALLLAVLLVAGPALSGSAAAQAGTPTTAGSGFVGSWRLVVTDQSGGRPPFPALAAFEAGGVFVTSNPLVTPAAPGAPNKLTFSTTGYGAWTATPNGGAALTFMAIDSDEQGHVIAVATIRATFVLGADGNSFSGPFAVTVAAPNGKVVFTSGGTVSGTRIAVEPMGSPVATPTS